MFSELELSPSLRLGLTTHLHPYVLGLSKLIGPILTLDLTKLKTKEK